MGLECIRKVVEVGYVLAVEFDKNVARFQACLLCGRSLFDIGETDAFRRLVKVRYAAEVRSITRSGSPASARNRRRALLHPLKFGAAGRVGDLLCDLAYVAQ